MKKGSAALSRKQGSLQTKNTCDEPDSALVDYELVKRTKHTTKPQKPRIIMSSLTEKYSVANLTTYMRRKFIDIHTTEDELRSGRPKSPYPLPAYFTGLALVLTRSRD